MGDCCTKQESHLGEDGLVALDQQSLKDESRQEVESKEAEPKEVESCSARVVTVESLSDPVVVEGTVEGDENPSKTLQSEPTTRDEDGLAVDFWNGSQLVHIVFTKTPWGLTFANTAPMTVATVAAGSHAAELGVEVGWVFQAIEGKSLAGEDFKADHATLLSASQSQIYLEFMGDSETKTVFLKRRPWGLSFNNEAPLTVNEVTKGGYAESRGINVGWVFRSVNGKVLAGKDYSTDKTILTNEARRLVELP